MITPAKAAPAQSRSADLRIRIAMRQFMRSKLLLGSSKREHTGSRVLASCSLMGHLLDLHIEPSGEKTIRENGQPLMKVRAWGSPAETVEIEQVGKSDWGFRFSDLVDVISHISAYQYERFTVQLSEKLSPPPRPEDYTGLFMNRQKSGALICFTQQPDYPTILEFNIPPHVSINAEEMLRRTQLVLLKHGLTLIDFSEQTSDPAWIIRCVWVDEGTIAHALSAGTMLCTAAHTPKWPEKISPLDVIHALEQDLISLLMGRLAENYEFDAKEFVDLAKPAGKIEFAKDIAQFANSPSGGLLLIGARTEISDGGTEYLKKISALDKNPRLSVSVPKLVQRLKDIADQRIYPAIEGLQITAVELKDGQVVYAYIPPQNPQILPFLVTGEMISDKYFGEFYSIPRRRRDGNLPVTAREIHRLVAGKLWR